MLESRLEALGYELVAITSPANEPGGARAPDLVLLNLAPGSGTNGVASANVLHQRWNAPVILLIDHAEEASVRESGLTEPDYIVRPFTDRELRAYVELALSRHDAAQAVSDIEDRFFETSVDMLCFLDFRGHFKRLNPAWERALGFTREELMARPFIEFVHPDDRERTLMQNASVRRGGQALSFENRYLCKDGSYKWFRWNAAPDSPYHVIYGVARDVTESKLAEEQREQLVQELQKALAEVKSLQEILPICSYCRKIRDDSNYWHTVENYLSRHTTILFSHSICPSCLSTMEQ